MCPISGPQRRPLPRRSMPARRALQVCTKLQIKLPSTANAHSFLAPCNNATGKLVAPQERYFHFSSLNVFLISAKTSRDCFYFNFAILTLTLTLRDFARLGLMSSTSLGYNYLWSNSNKSFYSLYNFLPHQVILPCDHFHISIHSFGIWQLHPGL